MAPAVEALARLDALRKSGTVDRETAEVLARGLQRALEVPGSAGGAPRSGQTRSA